MKNLVPFQQAMCQLWNEENLKKIKKYRVGIAGAGGLGSNCAMNLLRSGFENFLICDFDQVEASNLNRQFYFSDQIGLPKVSALKENLLRINPQANIEIQQIRLDSKNVKEIFADCDAVVEAFDKADCKAMIVEAFFNSSKFLVSASGIAGCGFTEEVKILPVRENFYLVGDGVTEVGKENPPLSPRVNVAAAKQADIILCHVLGIKPVGKLENN